MSLDKAVGERGRETFHLKNGILNEEEIVGKFGYKLSTYSYKFIQNAADNYTFYSIEREK